MIFVVLDFEMFKKISIGVWNYWWCICQLLLLTSEVELEFGEDECLFQMFKHLVKSMKFFGDFKIKHHTTVDCRCEWSRHECESCWETSGVNCNNRPYHCICTEKTFSCKIKKRFCLFGRGRNIADIHDFLGMMVHQLSLMTTDYTSGLENTLLHIGLKYDHWGILELALNRGAICSLYTNELVPKCLRGYENPLILPMNKMDLSSELSRKTYLSYLSMYPGSLLSSNLADEILPWSRKYSTTLFNIINKHIGANDMTELVVGFLN